MCRAPQSSRKAKSHRKLHFLSLPGVGAQGYLELLVMFGAGLREMNSFQQRWKMSLYAGL